MRHHYDVRAALVVTTVALLVLSAASAPAASTPLALVGGTIYIAPNDAPIADGVVLMRDGKIVAVGAKSSVQIPPGTETLDCTGSTITAGFWNSHVHFMERKWSDAAKIPAAELTRELQGMLTQYGFTNVFDTGSVLENTRAIRDRIESGDVLGPRIRTTGPIIYPKGGAGTPEILDVIGFMHSSMPEVATPDEARAAAKQSLDGGSDGIKLYAALWYPPFTALPEDAMRAAVEEAHARHKPAFAHPTNLKGMLSAVRAGVDIIVHTTPQGGEWDQNVLTTLKQAHVAIIPTLKLWKYELRHDRMTIRDQFAGSGIAQLHAWLGVNGEILFGTDVGYMNDYDTSDEYSLMAEAGMNARQILASLTTAPASRFGDDAHTGRLMSGAAADIVVLRDDPTKNVRAFANVRYTIRNGVLIYDTRNGTH